MRRIWTWLYKHPPKRQHNPGSLEEHISDFNHLVERVATIEGKILIMAGVLLAIFVGVFALVAAQFFPVG